jgi:hypothetical protein
MLLVQLVLVLSSSVLLWLIERPDLWVYTIPVAALGGAAFYAGRDHAAIFRDKRLRRSTQNAIEVLQSFGYRVVEANRQHTPN